MNFNKYLLKNIKTFGLFFFVLTGSGCQLGYLMHVSYNHMAMLSSKKPIEEVLKDSTLPEDTRKKLALAVEVKEFAFTELGLKRSKNYSDYVDLKRDSVTYAVTAAYKWKLEPYLWNFPFIGKAPYKGFYSKEKAMAEADLMKKENYDVFVRGVAAYSTLGKLNDPLLSSMMIYKDHDLVNTIIHELVHTHLFIKDNIDFNERLAVFVANKGTEIYFLKKEGANSPTLKLIQDENSDDAKFSEFISVEIKNLKQWYIDFEKQNNLSPEDKEKLRQEKFKEIKLNFEKKLLPQLKTKNYVNFSKREINNAYLSSIHTYMTDLSLFEKVYQKNGAKISDFLKKCEQLNQVDDPEKTLKEWADSE